MFHVMRNSGLYGTLDLVERFMSALREFVPSGMRNRIELVDPARDGDAQADTRIKWTIADQQFDLRVNVKVSAPVEAPRLPPTGKASLSVLIAPYISKRVQSQLERAGHSFWDPTGNALLQNTSPFLLIRQFGAKKNPDGEVSQTNNLRSLKGKAASEVIVRLLATGGAPTVRDLARETGVGLGTASRVVALLRAENLLEPTGGGPLIITDRIRLARRWAEDYSFMATFKPKRYFSILGAGAALNRVQQSRVTYALTGLAAQARYYRAKNQVPPLPASDLWIYTDDVSKVETTADLVPDEAGTILVAETDFLGLGREGYRVIGQDHVVWPWRAAGDLLSAPGRYAAVGNDLAQELASGESNAW